MRFLAAICAALVVAACALHATPEHTATTPPTTTAVASQPTHLPEPLTVTVTNPAVRLEAIQLTEPPPAPTTTVLTFADDCAEMAWYRQQAGLPARFDGIGYRESRCTNTAISRTGCCVGWWQIHHINFRDHRTIAGLAACDATWLTIRGDTPDAKQRQTCAAKVLYDVVGYQPWALTA